MTITLSPEDVKKFTSACRDWEIKRSKALIAIAMRQNTLEINWSAVIKEWSTEPQEPFPNIYQVLGL